MRKLFNFIINLFKKRIGYEYSSTDLYAEFIETCLTAENLSAYLNKNGADKLNHLLLFILNDFGICIDITDKDIMSFKVYSNTFLIDLIDCDYMDKIIKLPQNNLKILDLLSVENGTPLDGDRSFLLKRLFHHCPYLITKLTQDLSWVLLTEKPEDYKFNGLTLANILNDRVEKDNRNNVSLLWMTYGLIDYTIVTEGLVRSIQRAVVDNIKGTLAKEAPAEIIEEVKDNHIIFKEKKKATIVVNDLTYINE
jgi:hypothetical protein